MREKLSGFSRHNSSRNMFGLTITGVLLGLLIMTASPVLGLQQATTTASTTTVTSPDMETCQCGVFLLGLQPLVFSAEAKPILSGMPVPANCSAKEDKLQCATICRQLIETMSQSHEDSPLVQTVVLAATRTLACQRFNDSEKVPLPRTLDATSPHHAKLDDLTNKWKFQVQQFGRSELEAERDHHQNDGDDADENYSGKLTKPKFLGGFYRWCDEHWIYAGISLHEPLCCVQHLPKKCPQSRTARNQRLPRLIIRRCKNDDCTTSDEEYQDLDDPESHETPSTSKTPPTNPSLVDSDETEPTDTDLFDNSTSSEHETINPFDETTSRPIKNRKPLNSTVVAEAFKFVNTLMDSLGYGDVVQGVTSVLPSSTAAELLERVDVGGWVSNYQERYMTWPREFSMGYCYVEYSLYNMASDGFIASTNNLLSRVFKANSQSPSSAPSRMSNMQGQQYQGGQQPPSLGDGINGSPPPPLYSNNPNNVHNFISQMPPLSENSFNSYSHNQPMLGLANTRRVKRSPGVTVSRSYSSAPASSSGTSRLTSTGPKRAVRRKLAHRTRNVPATGPSSSVIPRARNVPATGSSSSVIPSEVPAVVPLTPATPTNIPVPTTTGRSIVPSHQISGNLPQSSFVPSTSFIPTNTQPGQSRSTYFAEQHQPLPQNSQYNQNSQYGQQPQQQYNPQQYNQQQPYPQQQYTQQQFQQSPIQRSHPQAPPSLTEYARPRRNPPPHPKSSGTAKQGPSGGNLMNIANMLVQTAMAGNGQSDGDKVTSLMQNAIPLVSQVAGNPAIQSMVSSLVTSFLTPPQQNKPRPPPPTPPSQNIDEDEEQQQDSQEDLPIHNKNPPRRDPLEDNEIDEPEMTSSNHKPSSNSNRPPNNGGGGNDGNMLTTMVSQMISTYIKHLFSPGQSHKINREPSSDKNKPLQSRPTRPGDDSSKPEKGESKDIVDMICGVAEPFFLSYFGIVPGEPGFGKLKIRREGHGYGHNQDGTNTDFLINDPDPGTGITDILFGSVNLPETGNGVYDFGNRVVYAFSRANDPQQGMYCFKQYAVNKLWDYFRVGVRAVFKK